MFTSQPGGLCFGDPRGDAALISESEERLELWSDMDGSLNLQGGWLQSKDALFSGGF